MAKKRTHKKLPDINILRSLLNYDPITGELTHSDTGKDATYTDKRGYKHFQFKRQTYKAHRICFYLFHGRDPGSKVIDHCDGNKGNNKITNLRAVSHRKNLQNTAASRKKTGLPKPEWGAHRVFATPL